MCVTYQINEWNFIFLRKFCKKMRCFLEKFSWPPVARNFLSDWVSPWYHTWKYAYQIMSQDCDNQCQRFEKDSVPPGTQDGCGAHWLPCGTLTVPCVVRQCRTCMQNDPVLILMAKITFSIHHEQAARVNQVNSGYFICDCVLTLHSRLIENHYLCQSWILSLRTTTTTFLHK